MGGLVCVMRDVRSVVRAGSATVQDGTYTWTYVEAMVGHGCAPRNHLFHYPQIRCSMQRCHTIVTTAYLVDKKIDFLRHNGVCCTQMHHNALAKRLPHRIHEFHHVGLADFACVFARIFKGTAHNGRIRQR